MGLNPATGTLTLSRSMPLLSHITGGRGPAARYGRASQTRRQGASEPTSRRPGHAMGCRPSGLIHIQQVRGVSAPQTGRTDLDRARPRPALPTARSRRATHHRRGRPYFDHGQDRHRAGRPLFLPHPGNSPFRILRRRSRSPVIPTTSFAATTSAGNRTGSRCSRACPPRTRMKRPPKSGWRPDRVNGSAQPGRQAQQTTVAMGPMV
jgi:hypothetical protein